MATRLAYVGFIGDGREGAGRYASYAIAGWGKRIAHATSYRYTNYVVSLTPYFDEDKSVCLLAEIRKDRKILRPTIANILPTYTY